MLPALAGRPAMVEPAGAMSGSKLSEAKLMEWQGHMGRMNFWSYTHNELYVLDPWVGKRPRIATHGLTGYAVVRNLGNASLVFSGLARLHLCRERPCGYRYDNRVPPYDAHGRVARLHGPDDGGAGEPMAAAMMVAQVSHCLPLEDLAAVLAVPPALESGAESAEPVESAQLPRVAGDMPLDPGELPLNGGTALAPSEPGHHDGVDTAEWLSCPPLAPEIAPSEPEHRPGGDATLERGQDVGAVLPFGLTQGKREALLWCLEDECATWRKPFTDVPPYVFVLWALHYETRVVMHFGEEATDLVKLWAPWAVPAHDWETWCSRPAAHVLATSVTADPESDSRYLVWPVMHQRANHWHIAAEVGGELPGPHRACGGFLCGDPAEVCVGPLLKDLQAKGLVPLPTACDGDCGIDVMLYWLGRRRTDLAKQELRTWCADSAWDRRKDDRFLMLFDSCVLPDWLSKLERLQVEVRAPLPAVAEAEGGLPPRVLAAVSWALSEVRAVGEDELIALAGALTAEEQDYWVKAFNEEGCGSAVAKTRSKVAQQRWKGKYRAYNVHQMVRHAKAYGAWKKSGSGGKARRGDLVAFLESRGLSVDKPFKVAFGRMVSKIASGTALEQVRPLSGRRRLWGRQGVHLIKAPGLRRALFEWFCQVRSLCKGRMPLQALDMKAQAIRRECIQEALRLQARPQVPVISKSWLARFRQEYSISLRSPNRRWKVPRRVLLDRLCCMWSNVIRLRTLALVKLGYDLEGDNFDQKPFHLNEAGSKGAKTLSVKGEPIVAIKELVAQTRERWTANTWVTSRMTTALAGPPMEVLFKGGDRILQSLHECISDGGYRSMFAQTSNSGSYRKEHVLTFLERALPAVRAADGDTQWRLLFCDRYRAHEGDAIQRLAWRHRFVIVFHGGGTTGVTQVNDTHLHGHLSKAYQELEMAEAFMQLAVEPGACPKRDRAACVRDLASVWRRPDIHIAALAGWKQNCILIALDGSEDRLASSEVKAFWEELGMDKIRQRIIEEVCSECEAGRLEWSFEVVYSLLEDFREAGFLDWYEEGQEDEGDLVGDEPLGEVPWDDGDCASLEGERVAVEHNSPHEPLDDAQEKEVQHHASRLRALEEAKAILPADARIEKVFGAVKRSWDREASGRNQTDAKVARAVRNRQDFHRGCAEQLQAELDRRRKERETQAVALAEVQKKVEVAVTEMRRQEAALEVAGRRSAELAAASKRRAALRGVAVGFNAAELGQGKPRGGGERCRRARIDLVQRVAAVGNELSADIQGRLPQWLQRWDTQGVIQYGMAWGSVVRDQMVKVIGELTGGDGDAFRRWHRYWHCRWRLDRDEVSVPAAPGAPGAGAGVGAP